MVVLGFVMFLIAIALYSSWFIVGSMHETLTCTMLLLLCLGVLLILAGAGADGRRETEGD